MIKFFILNKKNKKKRKPQQQKPPSNYQLLKFQFSRFNFSMMCNCLSYCNAACFYPETGLVPQQCLVCWHWRTGVALNAFADLLSSRAAHVSSTVTLMCQFASWWIIASVGDWKPPCCHLMLIEVWGFFADHCGSSLATDAKPSS